MDDHGSTKLRAAAPASASGSRVPDDALVEMLELLPAKSLHRFKCVSKAWCALLTDPLHRHRFAQTLAGFLCSDAGFCKCCRRADRRISITRRRRFVNVSRMAAPLVDATFPFLPPRLQGFRDVILDARDGLVLLARFRGHGGDSPGLHPPPACYLVCNPATARWASVPPPPSSSSSRKTLSRTYLLFDAAGDSPHAFHLLQFRFDDLDAVRAVHTYSSAAGVWTDRAAAWRDGGWSDWGGVAMAPIQPCTGAAVANGFLHLAVDTDGTCASGPNNNLVAVDEEGNTRRTIPLPRREVAEKDWHSVFVARSQGRLHYLMCVRPPHGWLSEEHPLKLLVWVLEDYDAGEWVLKHTVGFPELFDGRVACQFRVDYSVVAVHPDGNWVFFVRHWDGKLVAYDMDRREVIVVADLGELGDELPTPYVPLYTECAALTNKQ
ncbi:unnamed protein product [Urochloa decumbens]|uniref:F-box domain-containing protein n=1 Tax=Urochloa decumbens TaxID=240449 RepID=A0ABC9FMV4_9POAL